MILGDVEETVTTVVIDDETYEEIYKVCYVENTGVGAEINYEFNCVLCMQ